MSHRIVAALAMIAALSIAGPRPAAAAGDAAAGQKIFRTQCSVCHGAEPGKKGIGPSLFGVVGRPAGTLEGYAYSEANKSSGLVWDAATIDRYLAGPQKVVPGTKMTYVGLANPAQRADVIAYLSTLK